MVGKTDTLDHSKQPFNWRNFTTCLFIGFGLFIYGYFTGIISTTLTKTDFLAYMNLIDADGSPNKNSTGLVGATTGVYSAGGFFGVVSAGWILDKFGRKFAVIYSSILCIISGAILAASQNIGMFIALRFFTGMGAYSFNLIAPIYTSELAPSNLRGFLVGLSGIWCAVGFAISTYFGIAFFYVNHAVSWRVPLALAVVWPLFMLVGAYWVPESPRYLLLRGKEDAARTVTLRQHVVNGDEDFARAEFLQMKTQAELDLEQDSSWLSFIRKPLYRKRALIVVTLAFIGQSSGNLVINNYGGILYSALGFDTYDQLVFQCGYITTAVVFAIVGSLLVDRIGRRMLLLIGLSGCVISLAIESAIVALYTGTSNKAGLAVGVAALYIFEAFYCISVDICYFVISVELFPTHLRAKGTTLAFSSTVLTNLAFLQAAPTAFANIGWKYFLVFIVITTVGIIWIYFVVPESSRIPLEEVADVFGDNGEVAIHARNIHIDYEQHQVIVNDQVDKEVKVTHAEAENTM